MKNLLFQHEFFKVERGRLFVNVEDVLLLLLLAASLQGGR